MSFLNKLIQLDSSMDGISSFIKEKEKEKILFIKNPLLKHFHDLDSALKDYINTKEKKQNIDIDNAATSLSQSNTFLSFFENQIQQNAIDESEQEFKIKKIDLFLSFSIFFMSSKTKRLLQFIPEHHNESSDVSTGGFVPKLKPFFIPYANSRRKIYKAGTGTRDDPTNYVIDQTINFESQSQIQELNTIVDQTLKQIDLLITFLENLS